MHEKKYEAAKKEIRSVLLTYKDLVPLNEFLKTYKNLLGQKLPSRDLGFSTDVDFLSSMPDVVDVKSDPDGKVYLSGIADKASSHIQKLVSRQRTSKPNNSKGNKHNARQPLRKWPTSLPAARELKPFLPGTLRAEFIELMSSNHSLTLPSFVLAYHQKFRKLLNYPGGLNAIEAMIKLIPEFEVVKENNEAVIYNRRFLKSPQSVKESIGKNKSPSGMTTDNVVQEKNAFSIHESGISDDTLKEFQMVLEKFPEGIMNIHFPPLYEKITKKPFDVAELGYNCIADLVEILPHIFKRVSNPDDERHWLIYPAESHIKDNYEAKQITDNFSRKQLHHPKEGVSAGVSSPILQYIPSTIPDYIDLNEYFPVYVSSISSPSLFWFHLETDESIEKRAKFERDMWNFYSNACDRYKMSSVDIAIGATCVVEFPDDNQYFRATIESIPSTELVNVSFVDYGGRESVPRSNVHYVWSKLHEYPTNAFKAELAGIIPSKNADFWSKKAINRFTELCNSSPLMALVKSIDEDNYSVYLCDTTNDQEIHVGDTLINEGYAEIRRQSHSNINTRASNDLEKMANGHNIPFDSDSSSTINEDLLQSDNSDMSLSESPINRKLSFFTDVQNDGAQSHAPDFHIEKHSRRYVKEIEVCEGSKIHLINLEKKLFMSCGELCSLLWSQKDANFLIRRLKNKEVDIPFLHVNKEDCVELFKQCLWYKIKDFEKEDSDCSSLILCPLEKAFDILNIFGHPAICLRIIMQNEMRTFDPDDEFWNEISYQELLELNDVENNILEEINKLCLFDLKAKHEAFKIQKLKHLRHHSNSSTEEIQRIENIINIIARRIKQIEAICAQYSSCS